MRYVEQYKNVGHAHIARTMASIDWPDDDGPSYLGGARTKQTTRRDAVIPSKRSRSDAPVAAQASGVSLTSVAESITRKDLVEFISQLDLTNAKYMLPIAKGLALDYDYGDDAIELTKFCSSKDGTFVSASEFLREKGNGPIYFIPHMGNVNVVPSTLSPDTHLPVGFIVAILEWKQRRA